MSTISLSRTLLQRFRLIGAAALLVTAAPLLLSKTSAAAPLVPTAASNAGETPVSVGWLNQMRQAGMRGDRSQIRRMVEIFQNPPAAEALDVAYQTRSSLLRPLAQLGATEALPTLDDFIQGDSAKPLPGEDYITFSQRKENIALSKAVRARILAQSGAQGVADDKARASAEVKRFFQELGQTPQSLNAAVAAYQLKNQQHYEAAGRNPDYRHDAVPVEVFAVRELADMAYRDRYRGFVSLPDVARVDFGQDAGAALKARLAPLSSAQRVAMLVSEISQKKITDNDDLRRAQLLADEGLSALPMVVAQQQDFRSHREQYRQKLDGHFGGFSVLDRAQENLAAIADAAAKPQVSGATAEADVVRSSWPRQLAPGY